MPCALRAVVSTRSCLSPRKVQRVGFDQLGAGVGEEGGSRCRHVRLQPADSVAKGLETRRGGGGVEAEALEQRRQRLKRGRELLEEELGVETRDSAADTAYRRARPVDSAQL
eukprot:3952875-Pleurochrysis_carterae.AAC.2